MLPLWAASGRPFAIFCYLQWFFACAQNVPSVVEASVVLSGSDLAVSVPDPSLDVAAAPVTPAPTTVAWPVALDLPPESVTMKSWDSLKGSMDDIGQEVQQVLLVRSDMSSLTKDLKTQQTMWHQAEQELVAENAELQKNILALQMKAQSGAAVNDEVADLQKQVEEAKRHQSDLLHAFDDEEKKHELEMGFMQNRTQQLESQNEEVNHTAIQEIAKAHDAQMHIQADYQALRLKATELQDRLRDGQKGLPLQQDQNNAKTRDLGRQLAEMQKGLAKMVEQVIPEGKLQEEIKSLKHQLDEETQKIILLTQEQATDANNCEVEREKHESVLDSEDGKLKAREKEVTQLCDAVKAQRKALDQTLSACQAGETPENFQPLQNLASPPAELRAIA